MSTLEIFATIFTLLCVFLAVKRNIWQYPIGLVGTVLYFFVFWEYKLYFSAYLQIFFTFVQFYGWWYWLFGASGYKPKITSISWDKFAVVLIGGTVLFASIASSIAVRVSDAAIPLMDAGIFGASVIAQWFLDRKQIQTWVAWLLVNIVSIIVYYSQGLMLTTGVYVILLVNTFWGYYEWNKELKSYKV